MNADAMITTFKSLKLFGMTDTIARMATQASPAYQEKGAGGMCTTNTK